MRIGWRLILLVIGLVLFAGETYQSVRMNREVRRSPSRYFWWSFIRLDSDPLNRHPRAATPCEGGAEKCANRDLSDMWVDPGWLTEALMVSALPAFVVSAVLVGGLGHLGINQVWSFMISMPLLTFGWFYFISWLVDRWRLKRRHKS